MRMIRGLMIGLALVALLPADGSAQQGRHFENAWFWGAKVGNMTYSTPLVKFGHAPMIGIEWLLTRRRAGLLIGLDRADFGGIIPSNRGELTLVGGQAVRMETMRRAHATVTIYPRSFGPLRPYAGLGMALSQITANPEPGSFADPAAIDSIRTTGNLLLSAGVQFQLLRLSLFGQATAMKVGQGEMLNRYAAGLIEVGVRYNFGSSVERPE